MTTQDAGLSLAIISARHARWGWQFVDPGPPKPAPMLWDEPVWRQPGLPDMRDLEDARARAGKHPWPKVGLLVVLVLGGLAGTPELLAFALLIGIAFIVPVVFANQRIGQRAAQAEAYRAQLAADFQHSHQRWRADVAAHDHAERQRLDTVPHWFPVPMSSTATRFDVFGGTPNGWGSLVTNLGGSLLGTRVPLLVLDLTDDDLRLGTPVALLARHHGLHVSEHVLPEDLATPGWLVGRAPADLADLLTRTALAGAPNQDDDQLTSSQLRAVITVLGPDVALARIVEGLHVLNRTADGRTTTTTLEERAAITAQIDLLVGSERSRDALRRSIDVLGQLTPLVHETPSAPPGRADDVVVVRTAPESDSQREIVQTLAFHALLKRIHDRDPALAGRALVVAGADRMGLRHLERLHEVCQRHGMRLVYLFKHLRDDLEQLVGAADGEVVFMRMPNHREAAAAAEFIGRQHTFKVGQVTEGFSLTGTESTGTNTSATVGQAFTEGSGSGRGGSSSNRSVTDSFSNTSGTSWNWSDAIGTNRGTTQTRTYDFTVEPHAIAGMEETAFVLVHRGRHGRRVVLADCSLAFLDAHRVSAVSVEDHVAEQTELIVSDPDQRFAGRLPHLAEHGYEATWVDSPVLVSRGWRIHRHDRRPTDLHDRRRVGQILAAHEGF